MTTSGERPRIAIVGPLLPFRGGIAQYNTLLARALADGDGGPDHDSDDTLNVSFSRQYPAFLYPGAGDRDPSYPDHREPGAHYLIDSINPLTWWRAARAIRRSGARVVFFHWWTVFWAPCFTVIGHLLRRRGLRVVLICHNLVDHEANGVKAMVSRRFLDAADGYLVHSQAHAAALRERHPERPVEVHPIPTYTHYPPARGELVPRGRLELLFFGFIRPYKGLDVLLEAFRSIDDADLHLTVIGEHWGDPTELEREYGSDPRVELRFAYVDDAEAAEYFARADFVVLPYLAPTPSAVVALAYHYDVPVVASDVAGLDEAVVDGQTGILVPPGDAAALAEVLRGLDRDRSTRLAAGVREYKATHGWDAISARVRVLAARVVTPSVAPAAGRRSADPRPGRPDRRAS